MNCFMKKGLIIIVLIAGAVLPGCKKFLNEKPQTDISAEQFWKSEDDIKSGIAAMYDGLQDCFDNNYTIWGDTRTDEVFKTIYGSDDYIMNALSATTTGTDWSDFYTT